jgi:hypothetical protein
MPTAWNGTTIPAPSISTARPRGNTKPRPDTLVLNTSEQWFEGDAQFTVRIDGVQQGGIFSVEFVE